MNSKPTVLVSENKTVFQTWFLDEIWQQYFNVEIIDPNKNYDVRSTVVVSDWVDFSNQQNVNERTLSQLSQHLSITCLIPDCASVRSFTFC